MRPYSLVGGEGMKFTSTPPYVFMTFCLALALFPSGFPKNSRHKSKMIFPQEIMKWVWVNVIECIQPKGVKVKMRGHKLRSGAYW